MVQTATANLTSVSSAELNNQLGEIASAHRVPRANIRSAVIVAWCSAVDALLEEGKLTQDEDDKLGRIQDEFHLSQSELDENGAFRRLTQGLIIRDLMDGRLPQRVEIQGRIRFNFQKSESLIWVFQNVDYYETQVRTEYIGHSDGMSVRIAKGVYYRTSAFKGKSVRTSHLAHVGSGNLAVTNKHLYFGSEEKSFRIPFNKIVAFEPFEDGVGVQRDAASAKPQIFLTGSGWFTYNLVTNVARLD